MLKVTWQELEAAELIGFKDMQPGDILPAAGWVVDSVHTHENTVSLIVTVLETGEERTVGFNSNLGMLVVRR